MDEHSSCRLRRAVKASSYYHPTSYADGQAFLSPNRLTRRFIEGVYAVRAKYTPEI